MMKRFLSVVVMVMVLLSAVPSLGETMFCPYCGTKVDSSYSFCPSCGKSLSGVSGGGQQSSYDSSGYLPGFYHTRDELVRILNDLYAHPETMKNKPHSAFPVRFSVNLLSRDGLTSQNWPGKLNYPPTSTVDTWVYDITRGSFESGNTGEDYIVYKYSPYTSDHSWENDITMKIGGSVGVNQFHVTGNYSENLKMEIMLSSNTSNRIVTFDFWSDGHIGYSISPWN